MRSSCFFHFFGKKLRGAGIEIILRLQEEDGNACIPSCKAHPIAERLAVDLAPCYRRPRKVDGRPDAQVALGGEQGLDSAERASHDGDPGRVDEGLSFDVFDR